MIKLFEKLLIETHSACNRRCVTCLRQNHPHAGIRREYLELPGEIVKGLVDEAQDLRFKGPVGFHWFNEPLLDSRIPSFVRYAKDRGLYTYIITNGDLLTHELASQLDGALDEIHVSLYDPENREAVKECFRQLFVKTRVKFWGGHLTTHLSPRQDLKALIQKYAERPCWNPRYRMIVSYTGDMALCCEDIACSWDLGNVRDHSLKDLWFNFRHKKILEVLNQPGGRHAYAYCETCPRDGGY